MLYVKSVPLICAVFSKTDMQIAYQSHYKTETDNTIAIGYSLVICKQLLERYCCKMLYPWQI